MNLTHIDIFLQVVDTGSITAAAKAVHLTQPAVSRNIKLLEASLGTALFERGPRRVTLTPAGRALVPRARALMNQVRAIEDELDEIVEREYFDLRIGTVDSIATYVLPRCVAKLRESHAGLEIKLHTARTARLLDLVRTRELDVALVAWSGPPPLDYVRIAPYRMQYWGRTDTFASLAECTTEDAVQAFPMVEIEALPGQPTMIASNAETYAKANSLASVKALVMAGFGVGALLNFMISSEERDELTVADKLEHDAECAIYLIGQTSSESGVIESLLTLLRDAF